jgi:predicted N-formylglutamate amidohydrolase
VTTGDAKAWSLLVTAEHGVNRVPAAYRELFADSDDLLGSHRGWDPGTLPLARRLARDLDGTLVKGTVTRLLVDLNRSATNPRVFSEITRPLPRDERHGLLQRYHRPHWSGVEEWVAAEVAAGRSVLHLGIHSFVPSLNGSVRGQDLALLYDPHRPEERDFVAAWIEALRQARPVVRVRRNHPYRGRDDGLTTALRALFTPHDYLGIEVEVSQRHVGAAGRFPSWIPSLLVRTLRDIRSPVTGPGRPLPMSGRSA